MPKKKRALEVECNAEQNSDSDNSSDTESIELHTSKKQRATTSMKQLKKMNMIKFLEGMTAVEKDLASFLTNKDDEKLAIPETALTFNEKL